MKCAKEKKNEV